jgi:hypothetical protein
MNIVVDCVQQTGLTNYYWVALLVDGAEVEVNISDMYDDNSGSWSSEITVENDELFTAEQLEEIKAIAMKAV